MFSCNKRLVADMVADIVDVLISSLHCSADLYE